MPVFPKILTITCIICILMISLHAVVPGSFNPFSDKPTGKNLKRFGTDVISDGLANRDMAISPDGNELFYTLQLKTQVSVILHSVKKKEGWTDPEIAWFSGVHSDLEPAFSPDGLRLYFASRRPVKTGEGKKDFDIWYMEKKTTGWSQPVHLPDPVNTSADEFYPCVNRKGDIYFTRDVGENKEDILVAKKSDKGFDSPVSLPSAINTAGYEFNAWVDPDEQFIFFTGYNRKDGLGNGDLYVSLKGEDGNWLPAKNPSFINSPFLDYCPSVTPDKKFLFFSSNRSELTQPFSERKSRKELSAEMFSAGNGNDDIYWVELAAVLDNLR